MTDLKDRLLEIIETKFENTEYYLVDLKISNTKIRNKITVLVDTDKGIEIDECGKLSQDLGKEFDEIIETAYNLEVSSPGIETPLKFTRQFQKNINRDLKVILSSGSIIKGKLIEVNEENFVILPPKEKKTIFDPVIILYGDIKEALVQISFK
jgi:ribosome maturation factor RimP